MTLRCKSMSRSAGGAAAGTIVSALMFSIWLLGTHCSREISPDPGHGGIDLGWVPPQGGLDFSSVDSLAVRVWVLDGRGGVVAGPVRSTLAPGEVQVDMDLVVPAGENRTVRMQLEGADELGPGSLYAGETGGVDILPGGRTDAVVPLRSTIPVFGEIEVEPGAHDFALFWRSVQGAVEYELLETGPSGVPTTWLTPDTLATVSLRASAGPDSTFTIYRVRAHLLPGGPSLYGDPFEIFLPALIDLPRVVAVDPAEGASGVIDDSDIVLTFDRAMDRTSLADTTVTLVPVAGGEGVELRREWEEGGVRLRLIPVRPMQRGVEYAVRVRTDLRDAGGRRLDQSPDEPGLQGFESRFTTELYNPLRVTSVDPADRAWGVCVFPEILLLLNRPARPASVSPGTVFLADSTGVQTDCDVALLPDSTTIRVQPLGPLSFGRGYVVTVSPGVRDMRGIEGEPLDQDPGTPGHEPFVSGFRTEVYDPLHVISVAPGDGETEVDVRPEILVHLSRAALEASVNSATVLLSDSAGVGAACDVILLPDSATIRVQPATALAFGRGYLLTVTPGVRDTRGPDGIPLDQDPATSELEPFLSGFRTLGQPSGPRVVSVIPADGERNHKVSDPVRVTFSRPVQTGTVQGGRFTVRRQPTDAAIRGSISWNVERTEFVLQPTNPQGVPVRLDRGWLYRVVVDPGGYDGQGEPFGILDDAGIPLDQDPDAPGFQGFSSLFRVEDNPGVQSIEPADGSNRVPVDTEIVIRFTKPMDMASVTGASLSLVAEDTNTPVQLEPFGFSSDTTRVTMRPSAPLSFYRRFRVQADTTLLSGTGSRFDANLNQDGYQAFSSTFRTEPPSSPLRVETVQPDSGAVDVPHDTGVRVWFSRQIRPGTISDATFTLKRLHQNPDSARLVTASREVAPDSLSARLVPTVSLRPSTQYEVRVTRFVEDLYGNYLDQDSTTTIRMDFESHFTTDRDRVAPRVVTSSPPDGATDVPETESIEVVFSEAMDASTLPGALRLLLDDDAVEGTLEIAAGADRAVLTPGSPLQYLRTYEVRVDTTATDLAGNPLDMDSGTPAAEPFSSTFTVREEPLPFQVVQSSPQHGDTLVVVTVRPILWFNRPVDQSTMEDGGVRLLDSDEADIPLSAIVPSAFGESVVLVPADTLGSGSVYHLDVAVTVTDTLGTPLDQDPDTPGNQPFRATFRTAVP